MKDLSEQLSQINQWIAENKPIDWISRKLSISRDTFRKRYPSYKGNQGGKGDREYMEKMYGKKIDHQKVCEKCQTTFTIHDYPEGRKARRARFCCIKCAKSRDVSDRISQYRTIARKHHEHKCCSCGFDKIIETHHVDGNHANNDPKNLVFLCPNCHQMLHSRFSIEIQPKIDKYIQEKFGPYLLMVQVDALSQRKSGFESP